jgi:hypothetical protein
MPDTLTKNNYYPLSISTDSARTDKEFAISGFAILVVSSPVNINLKMQNINNGVIPLKQYDYANEADGFEKFFISHSALAGGTIKLLVYTDPKLVIGLGAGASSGGGRATTIGESSLALTLADTEYSVALTDNTKKLKLINNSIDAVFYVSFAALGSGSGLVITPLTNHVIENIDLESYTMYVQSDIASRTLYYMEFL